jgi:hypothetical protein
VSWVSCTVRYVTVWVSCTVRYVTVWVSCTVRYVTAWVSCTVMYVFIAWVLCVCAVCVCVCVCLCIFSTLDQCAMIHWFCCCILSQCIHLVACHVLSLCTRCWVYLSGFVSRCHVVAKGSHIDLLFLFISGWNIRPVKISERFSNG